MEKLESLLSMAENMDREQLQIVSSKIIQLLKGDIVSAEKTEEVEHTHECKKCGMSAIVKYGKDSRGMQRYKCKNCNTIFNSASYTVVSRTRHNLSVWEAYVQALLDGLSLAKCAKKCNISVQTAFVWRHKILNALQKDQDNRVLGGIVETDETYVSISYKGNHKNSKNFVMPRESYKRGTDSRAQIGSRACVLCAHERNGQSYGEVLGKGQPTIAMLSHAFGDRLLDDTIVISDKSTGIRNYFSKEETISLVQLMAHVKPKSMSSPPEVRGSFHIQNVNNMHSRFHRFMRKYNGVSTKYLNHYLNLFVWIENHKKIANIKLEKEIVNSLSNNNTYISQQSITSLPAIPTAA